MLRLQRQIEVCHYCRRGYKICAEILGNCQDPSMRTKTFSCPLFKVASLKLCLLRQSIYEAYQMFLLFFFVSSWRKSIALALFGWSYFRVQRVHKRTISYASQQLTDGLRVAESTYRLANVGESVKIEYLVEMMGGVTQTKCTFLANLLFHLLPRPCPFMCICIIVCM